jgi:hypothetical protein
MKFRKILLLLPQPLRILQKVNIITSRVPIELQTFRSPMPLEHGRSYRQRQSPLTHDERAGTGTA